MVALGGAGVEIASTTVGATPEGHLRLVTWSASWPGQPGYENMTVTPVIGDANYGPASEPNQTPRAAVTPGVSARPCPSARPSPGTSGRRAGR